MERVDLLVIGAGVVGLSAARAFQRRHTGARVVVLDKEPQLSAHASGRNSGVLHAGFYYASDSLKARFCREGNLGWRAFCAEHGVDVRACGKLVVASDEAELPALEALYRRGLGNGVRLEMLSEAQAREIEPRVKTRQRALYSPDTAVLDPRAAMAALARDSERLGVEIRLGEAARSREGGAVQTTVGRYLPARLLNCAGLHADRVARAFGAGEGYRLVPFRGSYLRSGPGAPALRTCIYPVPDPEMPFLGVHLTVRPDGGLKVGPTAMPARWREDYGGLSGISARDIAEQIAAQASLLSRSPSFRRHARREIALLSRAQLVRAASLLADGLSVEHFPERLAPGIRAQLVRRDTSELVSDFVIEAAGSSLHVLNAVSPALTCALPFAEHITDRLSAIEAAS